MKIDAHIHSFLDESSLFQSYPKRTEADIMAYLDQNEMDMAIMLPIAPYDRNETIREVCRKYPERLIGYCSIHPTFFRVGEETTPQLHLRRLIIIEKFRGLKLHPRLQQFSLKDPRVYSLLYEAARLRIPVVIDGVTQGSYLPMQENDLREIDTYASIFYDLPIIVAHLGGEYLYEMVDICRHRSNVFLDLSWIPEFEQKNYQGRADRVNAIEYAVKTLAPYYKLIYGSDYPEESAWTIKAFYEQMFKDLNLPKDQQNAIWSGTIVTILQL
jgi:predicted TIM-barrel fold metal-dependent hydrolase